MSRQKIEMFEDNVNKCNQKICNLEEICENLKENQKYSILTEGEYDIDDIKEENIVNLDSKKLKHKEDTNENEISNLENKIVNNENEIRKIEEKIKALENNQVSLKSSISSCENASLKNTSDIESVSGDVIIIHKEFKDKSEEASGVRRKSQLNCHLSQM